MTGRLPRRRVLQATGGAIALAGCLGDEGDERDEGDDVRNDDATAEDGDPGTMGFDSVGPISHDYVQDGRYAYVTLGPGYGDAGVLVVDVETFEIETAFPDVPANYGAIAHPEEPKLYLNGGVADTAETEPAGEWWVYDTERHERLASGDSAGADAHGVAFTPDAEELWMVNRDTDDAIVIDTGTDEIVAEIDAVASSPDTVTIAPDGAYAYVTTRGPNPQSATHAIAGDEPGVAVVDVAEREPLGTVQPDAGNDASDFHGIGLVPGDGGDYEVWAIDQGTATLYVLEPAGEGDLAVVADRSLGDSEEDTPHTVAFDSEFRYAVIPNTSGATTRIVSVDDRETVSELDTGPGSHFAGVTPDDETIHVDVIGGERIVAIDADFETGTFEIEREFDLSGLSGDA
ncbi:YncE family protein [Halosolutus amylolyticus]|uniref:YncE family protein n=1 Tax=Halosolutus amylolyticus TaxID=2932267 RepID=A0ABD5PNQ9_9EURY|nr:hypothetical protein [Halosolutus amylolyticus]